MIFIALLYSISISLFASEAKLNQLKLTGHLNKLTFFNSKALKDRTKHTPHEELKINNPWEEITVDHIVARLSDKPASNLNYLIARLLLEKKRIHNIEDLSQIRSNVLEACNGGHSDALHLAAVMIDQNCVFKRDFTTVTQAITYCNTALEITKNKTQEAELNALKTKLEKYLEEEIEKANRHKKKKKSSDKKTAETAADLATRVFRQDPKTLATEPNIGKLQSVSEPNDQIIIALSRLLKANGKQADAIKKLLKAQGKDTFNQNILQEIRDSINQTSDEEQQREIAFRCIDILKKTEQEDIRKVSHSILTMLADKYQEIQSMCIVLKKFLENGTDSDRFQKAIDYLDCIFDKSGRKTGKLRYLLTKVDIIDEINALSQESYGENAKLFQAQFKLYLGKDIQENCAKIKEAADKGELMAAYRYAMLAKKGTVKESEESILNYLKTAASIPKAAFEAGKILCNERSSNYNLQEGTAHLSAAAENGLLEAKELLVHLRCTVRDPGFEWNIPPKTIKNYLEESKETSGRARLYLGMLKLAENEIPQAIEEFKHGINLGDQLCMIQLVDTLISRHKEKEAIEAIDENLSKIKDESLQTKIAYKKYTCLSQIADAKAEEYLKELKENGNCMAIIHYNATLLAQNEPNPEDEKKCAETMDAINKTLFLCIGFSKEKLTPLVDSLQQSMHKRGGDIWRNHGAQLTRVFAETQE